MKAIVRNNRVVERLNSGNKGLPLNINWSVPEPSLFYHLGTFVHEVFDTHVDETRTVELYPLDYCKTLVKKELKKRREALEFGGFEFEGVHYESDPFSLTMMTLLPPSVVHFKTGGGFIDIPDTGPLKQATVDHIQNSYSWEGIEAAKVDEMATHQELIEYYNSLIGE